MDKAFTPLQLDALREVGSIGTAHAVTALSKMLGKRVDISVPRVRICGLNDLVDDMGGDEQVCTGIAMGIRSDIDGFSMLLLKREDAIMLSNLVTGRSEASMDELAASALREITNICLSSCLNALHDMTGIRLVPTVPDLATDMVGALLDGLCARFSLEPDQTLVIETQIHLAQAELRGYLLLVPSPDGLWRILDSLERYSRRGICDD